MAKLLAVLLIGLTFEAIGVVMLKQGINQIGSMGKASVGEVARIVKVGGTNPSILGGVFFEALFFGCLLYLMSQADVSFVWPMTALSFVFTTVAARMVLHEMISPARWAGVLLIVTGAFLISWSEGGKKPGAGAPKADSRR
jgi:drug/metabolite transporter (DMT)-like permease